MLPDDAAPPPSGRARRSAGLLALLLLTAACAPRGAVATAEPRASGTAEARPAPELVCAPPAAPVIRSALYFGQRRATSGAGIAPEEWESFLAREITPRLGGLTVFAAEGQWLGADGPLVREPSRVVVILHPDDAGPRAAIAEVIRLYRERFDQESVLWETTAACAAF